MHMQQRFIDQSSDAKRETETRSATERGEDKDSRLSVVLLGVFPPTSLNALIRVSPPKTFGGRQKNLEKQEHPGSGV